MYEDTNGAPKSPPPHIRTVVRHTGNTVAIVNSGSGIKITNWDKNTAAILYAWYPGQNGNIAMAEILSGKTNPLGKLPVTIEKTFRIPRS